MKPNFSSKGTNTVAPVLPKPGTGSVGKLKKRTSMMYHIPSKGNAQCLIDLIVDKGLYEANHSSKKVGPRQDLNRASMVIEGSKKNPLTLVGSLKFQTFKTSS